jgi:hypothetical protein
VAGGFERVWIKFMLRQSPNRRIDGLWIGCFAKEIERRALDRIEESLQLIKLHDPLRYKRVTSDLARIWVNLIPGYRAWYRNEFRMCELDERFVLADATTPETIASVIVHEATHARLMQCSIGYDESIRSRVEAICIRRQVAFTTRLPGGADARDEAERSLGPRPPEFWTNTAYRDRRNAGAVEALRHLGVPNYRIRAIFAVEGWIVATRRAVRYLAKVLDKWRSG